jgi:radical SAM superfamily enzyme YgiQ (UPF0313 family)
MLQTLENPAANKRAEGAARKRRLSICLINPRFEPSFWGYEFAAPLMLGNKRSNNPGTALLTLAALAPGHCDVTIIDENVDPIDYAELHRFDVIGVTGMIVQAQRMREILLELKKLPAIVAIGGPFVTVAESRFEGLSHVRFIGESEETWPAFLEALATGAQIKERYEQADKTDMRTVPVLRLDLIKAADYAMATLQFSRGCPFLCEFCDIITMLGRRPRTKSVEQMIKEFDAVRDAGFRACFLADDNFIANKKEAKALLRALLEWQKSNGFPLQLYTEASINLADDSELIDLMYQANFRQVFVGIETPRKASLKETRKVQNLAGDSMEAKIQRIRDGGLVVIAGFIVGFDNDDEAIFDEQFDFIQRTGIAQASVGLLTPIPTTPLYDRLKAEGRLDFSDPDVFFHPKQMTKERLKDGHAELTRRLYEAEAFFERLFGGYLGSPGYRMREAARNRLTRGRPTIGQHLRRITAGLIEAGNLAVALAREGKLGLGGIYLKVWLCRNLPLGRSALGLDAFARLCIVHWHFYKVVRLRRGLFGAAEGQHQSDTVTRALAPAE